MLEYTKQREYSARSRISECIHVKPTCIKDKNGHSLTKMIIYTVDLLNNAGNTN